MSLIGSAISLTWSSQFDFSSSVAFLNSLIPLPRDFPSSGSFFGPKKLPELGKSLGKGIREFKKATDELKSNWEDHVKDIAEPINDMKRDIHNMGQSIKTDVYNHLEKSVETAQPKELPAPAATAAAAATATNNESHEANT